MGTWKPRWPTAAPPGQLGRPVGSIQKALPDMGNLWDTYHTQNPAQLVDVEAVAAKLTATATRSSSGQVLNAIAPMVPQLMGGSADLAPSNKTVLEGEGYFSPADRAGRNIHFGVRGMPWPPSPTGWPSMAA